MDLRPGEFFVLPRTFFDLRGTRDGLYLVGVTDEHGSRYTGPASPPGLDNVEVGPRRLGNSGSLAVTETGLYLLASDGALLHFDGRGSRQVARHEGATGISASASGQVYAVSYPDHLVIGASNREIAVDMSFATAPIIEVAAGEDRVAVSLATGLEPWLEARLLLFDLSGTVIDSFGQPGQSIVEPRFVGEQLWARSDAGGSYTPGELGVPVRRPPELSNSSDLGEVPLGGGRCSYLPAGAGYLAVLPTIERAGIVDSEGGRIFNGPASSLAAVGEETGFISSTLEGGIEVRTTSRCLDRVEAQASLRDLVRHPLSGLGTPGLLLLPSSPRAVALVVHGGPVEMASLGYNPKYAYLLAHGIGLALVDYPGSYGYGKYFRKRLQHSFGVVEAEALDRVGRSLRHELELPVVGIGSSSAGFSLLSVLALSPDLFAGLVLAFPLTDLGDEDAMLEWLRPPSPPAFSAITSKVPVLITHGTADPVVPVAATRRFVASHGGRLNLTLHEFDGEGHGYSARAALVELELMGAFLESALRG